MNMTPDERLKYELRTLQSYLRNVVPLTPLSPDNLILSPDSLAIRSAIAGLENQLLRLERDEKLRRKFASTNENENCGGKKSNSKSINDYGISREDEEDMDDGYVKMTKDEAATAALTTSKPAVATAGGASATKDDDDGNEDAIMDDDWEEAGNIKNDEDFQKDDSLLVNECIRTERNNSENEDLQEQYFRSLASATVAQIASSKIHVATPLGALGLALHIALLLKGGKRSGSTGIGDNELRCTGVPSPDDGEGGSGGFAPPVRELPPGVLVPDSWEKYALTKKTTTFRYWLGGGSCQGGGMLGRGAPSTVHLSLRLLPSTAPEDMDMVHITFGPRQEVQTAEQPSQPQLTVKLGTHINLDGFKTAKKTSTTTTISPSLFYISLSELLSQFDATFGGVLYPKTMETTTESNEVLCSKASKPVPSPAGKIIAHDVVDGGVEVHPTGMHSDRPSIQILEANDTAKMRRRGDFEGDLLPGGPLQPPFGVEDNTTTIPPGSQVGPDHPIFDRTFGDDAYYDYEDEYRYNGGGMGGKDGFGLPGLPSGMGMRPR